MEGFKFTVSHLTAGQVKTQPISTPQSLCRCLVGSFEMFPLMLTVLNGDMGSTRVLKKDPWYKGGTSYRISSN